MHKHSLHLLAATSGAIFAIVFFVFLGGQSVEAQGGVGVAGGNHGEFTPDMMTEVPETGSTGGGSASNGSTKLLQKVGNMTEVSGKGFQAFYEYFNGAWPWVLSVAVGIAVLNGVMGGMMVMIAGDNSGMRGEGISKVQYSVLGLVLIAMAGTILNLINPTFYK